MLTHFSEPHRAHCATNGVGQQRRKQWWVDGVQDATERHQVNQAVEDSQGQAQGSISELPAQQQQQKKQQQQQTQWQQVIMSRLLLLPMLRCAKGNAAMSCGWCYAASVSTRGSR